MLNDGAAAKPSAEAAAKHTPGPWRWEGYSLEPVDRDYKQHSVHTIIEVENFAYGFLGAKLDAVTAEDAANRTLIAAAPDLLAALQGLIRAGHSLTPGSREWNAAHAAVDKAAGGAA